MSDCNNPTCPACQADALRESLKERLSKSDFDLALSYGLKMAEVGNYETLMIYENMIGMSKTAKIMALEDKRHGG